MTIPVAHTATPLDTSARSEARYVELLRAMQPWQRLAQAVALGQAVRELAVAGILSRHPHATDEEVRIRLCVRLYGRELASRVYGVLPPDAV